VFVYRAVGDDEPFGDGAVAEALGHQRQDVALTRAEPFQAGVLPGAGEQLRHDLGVDGGAAVRHAPQRVQELLDPADPFLEQIAEAADTAREQIRGEGLLDVCGEHEDGQAGPAAASLDGRDDPLVGVGRWHPHVEDGHVRLVFPDGVQGVLGVARGGHHVV
jgi:hypothetical protein